MSASNCMRAWTKSNTQPESHFCIGFFLTPCASVFTSGNLPYTLVPPRPGFSLLTNPVPGLESHSGLGLDTLHGYRCPHDCLGMSAFLVANHTFPPSPTPGQVLPLLGVQFWRLARTINQCPLGHRTLLPIWLFSLICSMGQPLSPLSSSSFPPYPDPVWQASFLLRPSDIQFPIVSSCA